MKVIEIKESKLDSNDKFTANKYPKSGLYFNTDENSTKELMDVNRYTGLVNCFMMSNLDHIPEYKPKEKTPIKEAKVGMISESTALKMLHIALRGKESDLNDI